MTSPNTSAASPGDLGATPVGNAPDTDQCSTGRRLGIALGGGGLRGIAHIGVLRVLEEAGICPDLVTGTSAGSLVGAFYAAGVSPSEMRELAKKLTRDVILDLDLGPLAIVWEGSKALFDALGLRVARRFGRADGLAAGRRLEEWVARHCPARSFGELKRPFAACSVDLRSGETVVATARAWLREPLGEGLALLDASLAAAVRASCSIPWLYVPKRLGGRLLVDGGVVHPVPARLTRILGAATVIAVDLSSIKPDGEPRGLARILDQAHAIGLAHMARTEVRLYADAVIRPRVHYGFLGAPDRIDDWIEEGARVTRAALPTIERILERSGVTDAS